MYFRDGGEHQAPTWLLVRSRLAEAWHCRPGEIDPDRDRDEIGIQIELWEIEHKYKKKK